MIHDPQANWNPLTLSKVVTIAGPFSFFKKERRRKRRRKKEEREARILGRGWVVEERLDSYLSP